MYKGYKDVYAKAPYWKNFNIVDDVPIPKVSEIKLDKTKYYSSVGNVDFVAATCYPEEALEKGLIWSSSDPSIVFVDKKTGQFIALQEGTATITAKAADGGDATATATVIVGNGINPDPATPCATPIIAYENCKVSYSCETEGAECHTSLSCSGLSLSMQSDNTLVLNGQFTISVYATAEGYLQSETATKTITLENIPLGESRDSDGTITIDDITDLINRYLQQE